jgi:aminopeptidase
MTDPRVLKLAQVLVHYSLNLQPGEDFSLATTPLAEDLSLAVYEEAIKAGANVLIQNQLPGFEEIFYKFGNDAQIQFISPVQTLVIEKFNAMLIIEADHNTRELSNVDPTRLALRRRARAPLFKCMLERIATGELKWCATVYPTHAGAQDADMSLREYQDFVYSAGMLDLPNPVAAWREEDARQQRLIAWLGGKDQVRL